MKKLIAACLTAVLGFTFQAQAQERDLENTLYMDLKDGRVVIELRPDLAPNHVARVKELARQGFYDGSLFHRVIDGFMAQTGDPTGTGTGGSGQKLKAEFSSEPHVRGTVSMARASDPDSADSQFFIVFEKAPHLDNQYTVFGKVVEGMENVDKIKKGDAYANGAVESPDKIVKMVVAADAAPAAQAAPENPAAPAAEVDAGAAPAAVAPAITDPAVPEAAPSIEVPAMPSTDAAPSGHETMEMDEHPVPTMPEGQPMEGEPKVSE